MGVRLWVPGFSLLHWEFTEKPWKVGSMIHVVIDKSWRHQYELMFQLIYRQLHLKIFIDMCILHGSVYTHISPCSVNLEGLQATVPL